MAKRLFVFILTIIFFSLGHYSRAKAAVVINEFLPNPSGSSSEEGEWIELYNSDSEVVDLTNWRIDDIEGGSDTYNIASGTAIPANSFLVYEKSTTGIGLNNDGDTVRLINNEGTVVDSYSYSSTHDDISYGRTNDGDGIWVSCATATKAANNNCPAPTSTPTPTPVPTATPVPTSTPTPIATATNTPVPTKTPTPTSLPTRVLTPTPVKTLAPTLASESILAQAQVLSESDVASPTPSEILPPRRSVKPMIISLLLVSTGLGILALGLVWQKRSTLKTDPKETINE